MSGWVKPDRRGDRPQLGAWLLPCLKPPSSVPQGAEGAWSFLCMVFLAKPGCVPGLVFPQQFPGSSIC